MQHLAEYVSATEYYGDGSNLTGIVAASATFATSAGFAASATNASFALSATNANFAASASFASSASYAASAGEASFAVSASSAAFATSADSATFAVSATNATTAYNVSGGIADISGLTAVSASISDLRAFQIGATSVSIGYLNVNAITAITISATDLKSSTLSFTSVSVSSLRVYRLAVETTLSATYGTFTGNVSAVSFYGDGSNLTGILVSIPTSVPSYTVNQLTIVSAATLAGVDLDTRINTVSVNTSVNAAAITSINTVISGLDYATSAELAATSAALATSISNSNTNITTNANAITSINTVINNLDYATSAELAAVSSTLATSIGNSNTNIAAVSALTSINAAAITSINTVVSNVSAVTSVNAAAITSINTILGDGSNFATSAELAATSAALATSISNHLPLSGGTLTGTVSGTDASFSGNVSASFFYGDGSNLTNLPSAPTSVSAYTVNQLTIVSAATLAGTDLETRINTVSVNTSVNSAAITSINTVINNLDYATSAELATVSSALATSIGNSNTNITTNTNAITSINTILGDGSNFATSAELAATSAALATSIATANTRITSVSDYAVALSATLATSISNSNTNIATVSALTSVNSAAITSINTVVANVSSTLATSIANHLPLAGGTLTGTVSGTDASFSGNVSASLFYGDGSNLTNLPSAPTSVTSFTVNQLTAVSTTSLMGITYPTTDGTSGQVLQTNGAGALTFVSVAGGGATDIDGLSDAITNSSGKTIGLGTGALVNDDGTTNNNTALGYNALNTTISGSRNVAVGYIALQDLTTGALNTAVGYNALPNLTTAIGNSALGAGAGEFVTSGAGNILLGIDAGQYITTGSNNIYVGELAGAAGGTGNKNIGIGVGCLRYLSSTNQLNTAIGANNIDSPSFNGNGNTVLGTSSGRTLTTASYNIIIGYNAQASSATVSNEITLGNASISTLRCNQTTISSLSDRRDKTDIEDLPIGLDFIKSLRPVKFRWDRRDGTMANVKDAGFIAQELDEVQQDFNSEEYMKMVLKTNPEKLEAAPGKLIPVLVKAIQELSQEVERLKEGK
jgi:trimeric autotransporter adhesin